MFAVAIKFSLVNYNWLLIFYNLIGEGLLPTSLPRLVSMLPSKQGQECQRNHSKNERNERKKREKNTSLNEQLWMFDRWFFWANQYLFAMNNALAV